MALDDQALITLNVQIGDAVANIQQFKGEYDAALKQMGEATKAGLGPGSVEFEQIKERALAAGRGMALAGEQGVAAMRGVCDLLGQIDDLLARPMRRLVGRLDGELDASQRVLFLAGQLLVLARHKQIDSTWA